MIINSILDNDMYKFTMQQAVLHNYPEAWVKYRFKCRNHSETLGRIQDIENFTQKNVINEIENLSNLQLTPSEYNWMSKIRFFKPDYLSFLEHFKFNSKYITCEIVQDHLQITIEGPWAQTILFEVPILSIVSELYTESNPFQELPYTIFHDHLSDKIEYIKDKKFSYGDMGTRRRAGYDFQHRMLLTFKNTPQFVGTSNLHFAKELNIPYIGTMAHEWVQVHQQLTNLKDSQRKALDIWAHEYRGDLGIALSDTLGFDKFLDDFDLYFCKLFDGCRHDSGDPYLWTRKLIDHYTKMNIDPLTKTAVYSDGLDFEKANNIHERFSSKIKTSFGIGTWLTNDIGITPPQIVIKMVECNGYPAAKISDDPAKGMCEDENYLKYLTTILEKEVKHG